MAPLVWLVTGCTSGFGSAFVESILAKGDKVIATARPSEGSQDASSRLKPLIDLGAAALPLDITADQAILNKTVASAISIYGHIDVLVNNAGNIDGGVLEEIDQEILTVGLTANLFGPLNLTRAILPHFRARRSGTIIFQGSVGSYFGQPGSSIYASGKGAIDGIMPSLAAELAPFGIRVCELIPGFFRTKLMTPGNLQFRTTKSIQEYLQMNMAVGAGCEEADGKQPGDPRLAADVVVDAVHEDGKAAGKKLPLRLPLGADAIEILRQSCKERLDICNEWEAIVSATSFPAPKASKL